MGREFREPEIEQFDAPFMLALAEHDMAGFRSRCVMPFWCAGGQRVSDRNCDFQKALERHPVPGYGVRERSSLDKFHRQEELIVGLLDGMNRDDIGVIQRGDRVAFPFETLTTFRVGGRRRGQELERDVPIPSADYIGGSRQGVASLFLFYSAARAFPLDVNVDVYCQIAAATRT